MMQWFKSKKIQADGNAPKRRELDTPELWKEILKDSYGRPVVLFKHSSRCGLSAMVLKRFEEGFLLDEFRDFSYFLLDVVRYRHISDLVARELLTLHESPQVILIHNRQALIDASHYDIVALPDRFREFKLQLT